MVCAACAFLALAFAARPLAAQANQNQGSTAGASGQVSAGPSAGSSAAGRPAAVLDESKIPLGTSPAGTGSPGATGAGAAAPAPPSGGVSTWDFVRMILVLACVLGIIYLLFWLLRRGAGRRVVENDLIRVLGSRGLSGSRSLHLVEVGSSVYLVGSSDGGVELISEITDKETLDSLRLKAAEQSTAGRRTFAQALGEIFRPAARPFSIGDGIGFLKGQRERLKKL
ncbi:MAG TPA: flagellar biosynthetic protein FliO [Spirochaetia bacterium]|nr:flagellar biosynthetic protein FliO [Spirochaetia bacterium]HTZ50696.1 flagellar biosynthetic protein FliO [Spirochaetia bacterium]